MDVLTGVVSVLIGGGVLAFIQFLITRSDQKKDKDSAVLKAINDLRVNMDERFHQLDKKVDMVDAKGDERAAVIARVRILRFADEMQVGQQHSKDSWDQVMADITDYNAYCGSHEGFRNGQTGATVEYITEQYKTRLEKHDFL